MTGIDFVDMLESQGFVPSIPQEEVLSFCQELRKRKIRVRGMWDYKQNMWKAVRR